MIAALCLDVAGMYAAMVVVRLAQIAVAPIDEGWRSRWK